MTQTIANPAHDTQTQPEATAPVMTVPLTAVDHVVFRVHDVEATVAWWHDRFGFTAERMAAWRAGDAPFPWVRVSDTLILDLWPGVPDGANVDHVAFVTDPDSFDAFVAANRDDLERPPATMGGARGQGEGTYILDPSGNRIEVRTYRGEQAERSALGPDLVANAPEIHEPAVQAGPAVESKELVRRLYGHIDRLDAGALGAFLADDVTFQLGNAAPSHGKEAVIAGNEDFFESVAGMTHTIDHVWVSGPSVICDGTVTYTRHDGSRTRARFATVLQLEGELIEDYRVYVDISQL